MIVFTFMQEQYGDNYLVTNCFKTDDELLDCWLEDFMSYGLLDGNGDPIEEDLMKDILTGELGGLIDHKFETEDGVYYTFSVVNTECDYYYPKNR